MFSLFLFKTTVALFHTLLRNETGHPLAVCSVKWIPKLWHVFLNRGHFITSTTTSGIRVIPAIYSAMRK